MNWFSKLLRTPKPDLSFDAAIFFAHVRPHFGRLKQKQVNGFNAVLAAVDGWPKSHAAYALATAWHETAGTMQPVKEYGGRAYYMRMYDKTGNRPHVAKRLGNTVTGDGAMFAGRGYVQLTGRANYARMSSKVGADLIANPDRAMEPEIAAKIMTIGMTEGTFTNKKLSDYLPNDEGTSAQFRQARRIINGQDKASKIAGEASMFQTALTEAGYRR